jgi:hypothetical protein
MGDGLFGQDDSRVSFRIGGQEFPARLGAVLNIDADNVKWFYGFSVPGDVVDVHLVDPGQPSWRQV